MAQLDLTQAPADRRHLNRRRIRHTALHILLIVWIIILMLPLIWVISTSFKDRVEFLTNAAALLPRSVSLVNYEYVLSAIRQLPVYLTNSFILAGGTAILQVLLASLAGYAFARMRFRGRDWIFGALLISIFIPRAGGLMALYELMAFLRLRNSLIGLILLFAANIPTAIFIMRQSFLALPQEIEEAALIDGANWFQVFWRIAIPLATSGMIVVATLSFVAVWSDFLIAYTMLDKDALLPIAVGIQRLVIGGGSVYEAALSRLGGQFAAEAANAAMLLFAILPVVAIYALLQKWFMKGLMEGAIKS
jgi:ABC-type glycerol-3-phosphate transport system permease component